VQHLEDVEAGVEADEVGERQRAHRVVHAELHHLVDAPPWSPTPSITAVAGLVDHRHQDAVGDEPGEVVRLHRHLAEGLGELDGPRVHGVARLEPADDLDELHHRHRVHEVHPDDRLGALGDGGDLGDGDRAGVGREDRAGVGLGVEVAEDLELELLPLGRRLDDHGGALHGVERGGGRDAGHGGLLRGLVESPLLHLAIEVLVDRRLRLGEGVGGDVDQRHIEAGRGADMGDPVAHLSGADDGETVGHRECTLEAARAGTPVVRRAPDRRRRGDGRTGEN
jgi:hypothetical protein